MKKVKDSSVVGWRVGQVATQTENVFVSPDEKQYDIHSLLAEIKNDLDKIKKDLSEVLK